MTDAAGRYPIARPRAADPAPHAAEKYERYEASGLLDVADAFALFHTFSGAPDCIELTALGGSVDVKLLDVVGREDSVITIPSGQTVPLYIKRNIVHARETVAAAGAKLNAVGKWYGPRENA